MNCNNEQTGTLLANDGTPLTFDGLGQHAFKLMFAKIPNTTFFLQGLTFPGVRVDFAEQVSPHLDFQEIGSKLKYDPLHIDFLVDSEFRNHTEIFNWLHSLTVENQIKDLQGDAIIIVNNSKQIRFVDCFPVTLGSINFVSNQDQLKYVTCSATFNFDWFEILPV